MAIGPWPSSPDLPSATKALVQDGAQCISIVPMFLGGGKHAREDLPVLVADLQALYPGVRFKLTPAIGEEARLVQLLALIALESLH